MGDLRAVGDRSSPAGHADAGRYLARHPVTAVIQEQKPFAGLWIIDAPHHLDLRVIRRGVHGRAAEVILQYDGLILHTDDLLLDAVHVRRLDRCQLTSRPAVSGISRVIAIPVIMEGDVSP